MKQLKLTQDLTPQIYACLVGACPAIYQTNQDSYVLVGKIVDAKKLGVEKKVSEDEIAVEVPRGLVDGRI